MGCPVTYPLEVKRADIGICGGKDGGILIKNGEIIKRVKQEDIVSELIKEIEKMGKEKSRQAFIYFNGADTQS